MKLWLNGAMTAAEAARIAPDDRGLLLGDGLFETLAVRDGVVLRVAAHLARLGRGCAILEIPLPHPEADLADALAAVASVNRLSHGSLRLTVTRGPAPRGLRPPTRPHPTVLITASASAPSPPGPATAIIAGTVRRNEHSPLARIKSLNYLDGVLAQIEADRRGADDALLLNTSGLVAEASMANVFVVLEGRVVTPGIEDGALPGLMRASVIETLGVEEGAVTAADLTRAGEVFLSNVGGIRPVVRIEGGAVGDGRPGPVWRSLGGLAMGYERP